MSYYSWWVIRVRIFGPKPGTRPHLAHMVSPFIESLLRRGRSGITLMLGPNTVMVCEVPLLYTIPRILIRVFMMLTTVSTY